MKSDRPVRSPGVSHVLIRLLDRSKHLDYLIAALFAALPVVLSVAMGLFFSGEIHVSESNCFGVVRQWHFSGYDDSPNFWTLVLILPLLLFAIRWAMARIAPVYQTWPPAEQPAILGLLKTQTGKKVVYETLRSWLLSPRIVVAAVLGTLLVHVIDMRGFLIDDYILGFIGDRENFGWRTFHLTGEMGRLQNLAFVVSAYAVQFAVVFLAFLAGFLLLVHNLFFLRQIYQRRWVPDGQEENYFEIDLGDEDRCFGFREANSAFNTQIFLLMAGGIMMLVSRLYSAVSWRELADDPSLILPNAGQTMLVAGWFAVLLIISLPALVKLLPRLPVIGNPRASRRVTSYLLEFISPGRWPFGRNPSQEEISALAALFASNSFWPTGNNRASQLFFFALWIGLIVLFAPPLDNPLWLFATLVLAGMLAYLGKKLIFELLNSSLRYVDSGLVDKPTGKLPELRLPGRKLDAGVFVSYRREDTAGYTGRLYDYLTDHFHRDQIFIDVESIGAGERFGEILHRELANSVAAIVMIGPRWTKITGEKRRPRLMDPDDWVRIEVATALRRGIPVFPVLVGGARLPSKQDLPEDLAALCDCNDHEISDRRWDYDAGRLMEQLRATVDERMRRTQ